MQDYKIKLQHTNNNVAVCIGNIDHTSEAKIPDNFLSYFYPDQNIKPKDIVKWRCWPELLQENLDLDKIIIETNALDNSSKILKALGFIVAERPSYCFLLLDHWLQTSIFSDDIILDKNIYLDKNIFYNDTSKRLKNSIINNLDDLILLDSEYLINFIHCTFNRLCELILVAKEFDCALVIQQSIDPLYAIKTIYQGNNKNVYLAYESFLNWSSSYLDSNFKKLFNFYAIGFPFINQNDYFFNYNNLEYFLPGCDNFLNATGQERICKLFKDKALWQRSEDGVNFLLK